MEERNPTGWCICCKSLGSFYEMPVVLVYLFRSFFFPPSQPNLHVDRLKTTMTDMLFLQHSGSAAHICLQCLWKKKKKTLAMPFDFYNICRKHLLLNPWALIRTLSVSWLEALSLRNAINRAVSQHNCRLDLFLFVIFFNVSGSCCDIDSATD